MYEHTQKGAFHYILSVAATFILGMAWVTQEQAGPSLVLVAVGLVMAAFSLAFQTLTVRDGGDALELTFGPLPLFRERIPYARITAVQADRSNLLDGWGIHWVPGRGWTYNIWGFGCVKITSGRRVIRVGSDDVDGLTRFLQGKLQEGTSGRLSQTRRHT